MYIAIGIGKILYWNVKKSHPYSFHSEKVWPLLNLQTVRYMLSSDKFLWLLFSFFLQWSMKRFFKCPFNFLLYSFPLLHHHINDFSVPDKTVGFRNIPFRQRQRNPLRYGWPSRAFCFVRHCIWIGSSFLDWPQKLPMRWNMYQFQPKCTLPSLLF